MSNAVADRLSDGLGLLVDLLEHEGLEAGLLCALVVPVELGDFVLDSAPVRTLERRALGPQRHDLAVARELHVTRLAEKRGRVRGKEHLVAPDPDHERHLVACADEEARMVVMDHDEREVALELVERETHCLDEVAVVMALDEMRDGLRVRLGRERVAVGREARSQLTVILDNAVQDDRELRGSAAGEGVRVELGDRPMRRPACVAEAGRRARAVGAGAGLQVPERADRAHVVETISLEQRDAGGVVAAVLQALEALEEQRLALTRPDVSDDSAHEVVSVNAKEPGSALRRA